MIKKINTGFSQQPFDFDQSREQDLQKVLTFIDSKIADDDQVMLDQVVNHFFKQSDRWKKPYVLDLTDNLFKNNKIHFIIDDIKILSEEIKSYLSEPAQSKSKFMQKKEIFLILKTHFSEPAQWKYVEIIKPEVVEESVLLKAQQLGRQLFNDVGTASQNSLCKSIRKHLRMQKSTLEEFHKVAGTGEYPGISEIHLGLEISNMLLCIYDPCEFIKTFINNKDRLFDAASNFAILEYFYKNQINEWNKLIKAVEGFEHNRMILEKDPDVKNALETLCKILKDPKPYSIISQISGLITIVKAANDPVV